MFLFQCDSELKQKEKIVGRGRRKRRRRLKWIILLNDPLQSPPDYQRK